MFDQLQSKGFNILALHHAEAIIERDFPDAAMEIEAALMALELPVSEIVGSGGGETKLTQRLRRDLTGKEWVKRNIEIKKYVRWAEDEKVVEVASISHEIDHVKAFGDENKVFALEIEWNNKDPFFDRDLENFKRLHAEGAISVAAIITRGTRLHDNMRSILYKFASDLSIDSFEKLDRFGYSPTVRQRSNIIDKAERTGKFAEAWVDGFVSDKFGEATTHWQNSKIGFCVV